MGNIVSALLLTKTERKACSFVHLTATGAGAEAWTLSHAECAGSSGAKLGTMVRDVACRREHWLANAAAGKDFLTSLIEWEIKIAAYEVDSGDKISDAVRVATIMKHAPEPTKGMWMRDASNVLPSLLHGQIPMQVSSVGDGGMGQEGQGQG